MIEDVGVVVNHECEMFHFCFLVFVVSLYFGYCDCVEVQFFLEGVEYFADDLSHFCLDLEPLELFQHSFFISYHL